MALRVPMLQQQVVGQVQRPTAPTLLDVADASRGVQALGAAALNVANEVEKARQEADAVRLTETLTELDKRTNARLLGQPLDTIDAAFEGRERTVGFLETKGLEASRASGDVLKGFKSDVDELANKLTPRQREAFMLRAQQFEASTWQRVQSHALQETQRAKVDVLQAAQSEALRAVKSDPMGSSWAIRSSMVEESIRGLATTPEGAEAAVKDWRGRVALEQIQSFLGAGDVARAQERFNETKDVLGTRADEVAAVLRRAGMADAQKKLDAEATAEVQKWVKAATPAGGYADEAKVLAQLEALPADDPRREPIEREVRQQLQVSTERKRADISTHRRLAWRADLDGKPTPSASEVFLREFDPDFLRGLKQERETRWRRWKADAEGTAADKAAARRKQAEDDEFLKLRFASLSPEEQASTTPEEYAKVLAAEFPDFSPSRNGYAAAGKVRADTVQRVEKGDMQAERRFVAEAEREVMALVTKKGKVDPAVARLGDPRTLVSGRASEFYRSKRAALGRDPTPDEEQAWLGELKLQPEAGWFGSKQPPAVLAPDFMPGGYGAPEPRQRPTRAAPVAPVKPQVKPTATPVRKVRRKLADGTVEEKTLYSDGSMR